MEENLVVKKKRGRKPKNQTQQDTVETVELKPATDKKKEEENLNLNQK